MKKILLAIVSAWIGCTAAHAFQPAIAVTVKDGTLQPGTTAGFNVSSGTIQNLNNVNQKSSGTYTVNGGTFAFTNAVTTGTLVDHSTTTHTGSHVFNGSVSGSAIPSLSSTQTWTGVNSFSSATVSDLTANNFTSSGTWKRNSVTISGTATDNSTNTYTGGNTFSNVNLSSSVISTHARSNIPGDDTFLLSSVSKYGFRIDQANLLKIDYFNGAAWSVPFQINTTSGTSMLGASDASDAPTGFVGEYISSTSANTGYGASTGQYFTIGGSSVILTAGDWQLDGVCYFTRNGATYTNTGIECGIGTVDGNSSGGLTLGDTDTNVDPGTISNTFSSFSMVTPVVRKSTNATTTYYLKGFAGSFSAGTPLARGSIRARRIR